MVVCACCRLIILLKIPESEVPTEEEWVRLPPIPPEELARLLNTIEREGEALDGLSLLQFSTLTFSQILDLLLLITNTQVTLTNNQVTLQP